MTARIVEFKHAPCRSDLKPLVVGARKLEICLGQAPVRCPHQQQRFDGCPGTAGGFGDDLNSAGILIEDRPFSHLYRTPRKNRQGQHRLLKILRTCGHVNLGFSKFLPVFQTPHSFLRLGMIRGVLTYFEIYFVNYLRHCSLRGFNKLRICRDDLAVDFRGGSLKKHQEVVARDVAPRSNMQPELGIIAGPQDEVAKTTFRDTRTGILRNGVDHVAFAALDKDVGD